MTGPERHLNTTDDICRELNTTPDKAQRLLDQADREADPQYWIDRSQPALPWPTTLTRPQVTAWGHWVLNRETLLDTGDMPDCCQPHLGTRLTHHWYTLDHSGDPPPIDLDTFALIAALAPLVPPARLAVYSVAELTP